MARSSTGWRIRTCVGTGPGRFSTRWHASWSAIGNPITQVLGLGEERSEDLASTLTTSAPPGAEFSRCAPPGATSPPRGYAGSPAASVRGCVVSGAELLQEGPTFWAE